MPESTTVSADELRSLEFFAGCTVDELDRIAGQLRPLAAVPGEVLMTQGEPASTFMVIRRGRSRVTHTDTDGEQHVHQVGPGVILGEISLLRGAPRNATVEVTEPLAGWVGGRAALTAVLDVECMAQRLVGIARRRLVENIEPLPVRLRDGGEMFLRPVLPGDNERVLRGPVGFSSDTLYRRFQTANTPSAALMAYLFEVDYVDHFVWVLTEGGDAVPVADGPVVADARFVRLGHDSDMAEIAFTVGDDYQGRGIGTFLMDAVVAAARSAGVERFTARVLSDNRPMRKILEHYGATWTRDDRNVIVTEFDVPASGELSLSQRQYREIYSLARHVIKVVG